MPKTAKPTWNVVFHDDRIALSYDDGKANPPGFVPMKTVREIPGNATDTVAMTELEKTVIDFRDACQVVTISTPSDTVPPAEMIAIHNFVNRVSRAGLTVVLTYEGGYLRISEGRRARDL